MKWIACANYEEMSHMAGEAVLADLNKFPEQLLCAVTGNSPLGLYLELARQYRLKPDPFEQLSLVKLDEWVGLDAFDPASCEAYLRTHLVDPLQIPESRYLGFTNLNEDLQQECNRIDQGIADQKGIGCCILGLGTNGHLGFNEPGDSLKVKSHVALLSATSRNHAMVEGMPSKPAFGITLGMGAILQSRKIVLLLTGEEKRTVIKEMQEEEISCQLPASFLWLHPNVTCYRDMQTTG